MDKANYLNDGSVERELYPLSNEGLDFIQNQILLLHKALANGLGKGLLIVSGCEEAGSNVSPGIVCINNEIMPFEGGTKQTKVRVSEASQDIVADYVKYLNCTVTRVAGFGANAAGKETYEWASFVRLKTNAQLESEKAGKAAVQELRSLIMPRGVVVAWNGSIQDIPAGWALCDGENGTPDLRNRFVLGGGGKYPLREALGLEKVTLSVSEMPRHRHGITIPASADDKNENTGRVDMAHNYNHLSVSLETTFEGGGQPHENMPPYFVLAYIMKL